MKMSCDAVLEKLGQSLVVNNVEPPFSPVFLSSLCSTYSAVYAVAK